MLTEHFAPTGLGRGGLAMAINIALLTEFSCVCFNRKFGANPAGSAICYDGLWFDLACPSATFSYRDSLRSNNCHYLGHENKIFPDMLRERFWVMRRGMTRCPASFCPED